MSPIFVVIANVPFQQSLQVPPVQNGHVIQQGSPDASNSALGDAVLPRTAECSADWLAAVLLDRRNNFCTELRVAVEYKKSIGLFNAPSFAQLQHDP